ANPYVAPAPTPAATEPPVPPKHRRPPHQPSAIEKEFGEDADDTPPPSTGDDEEQPSSRRGLLFMPFLGVHIIQGIAADDFGAGGRLGFLIGTRLDHRVSLNVETAIDILSPNPSQPMASASGHDLTIAFSPLFHAGGRTAELVVGPKLGFWSDNFTVTSENVNTRLSQSGWAYGANLGLFTSVQDAVEVGLLLAYQFTAAVQSCGHDLNTHECVVAGAFPPEIMSFSAAAMF
ncbi:MAG: hypothetical protein JWM82_4063, partial [Myxococcales bacterium]|nr:hypothetical protein [Myxococcales bacterium]